MDGKYIPEPHSVSDGFCNCVSHKRSQGLDAEVEEDVRLGVILEDKVQPHTNDEVEDL